MFYCVRIFLTQPFKTSIWVLSTVRKLRYIVWRVGLWLGLCSWLLRASVGMLVGRDPSSCPDSALADVAVWTCYLWVLLTYSFHPWWLEMMPPWYPGRSTLQWCSLNFGQQLSFSLSEASIKSCQEFQSWTLHFLLSLESLPSAFLPVYEGNWGVTARRFRRIKGTFRFPWSWSRIVVHVSFQGGSCKSSF